MSSRAILQSEKEAEILNSPDSSGGEESRYYDYAYGSNFQSPELTQGFVIVHKNFYCARYHPSKDAKGVPFYNCLNKSTCRSLAGGQHPVLRGGVQRAKSGTYEGIFGSNGKLLAAKSGTLATSESLDHAAKESQASDCAQVNAIKGMTHGLNAIDGEVKLCV